MKIKNIKKIKPVESKCLSVNNNDKLFSLSNSTLTHNSVLQRSIIMGCVLRPDDWTLLGIDLKRVELNLYEKYDVRVAKTMEAASVFLKAAQAIMMNRYMKMEELRINNYEDMPEGEKDKALMVMIDELGELLAPIKGKSEESKQLQEAQEEVNMALASIARLGRAARVFLVLATQRPSADIIDSQVRDNLGNRIVCGRVKQNISTMMFGNSMGTRIRAEGAGGKSIKGGIAVQSNGGPTMLAQGFFSGDRWIDEYFEKHGGFKSSKDKNKDENFMAIQNVDNSMNQEGDAAASWDADMDSIYDVSDGIDL